ncbi:MAG: PAS domain S-box protein [Deltaproteobacteria bacterium]|nr:PAS domain S-box protein [Deltaproteobacteria bacterium]
MGDTLRILIVEDNLTDVDLIRESLVESRDFEVSCTSRLSDALALLRDEGVDLMLLDPGLPDSQGLRTYIQVRDEAPDLPVVLLTGAQDHEMAIAAIKEGAQDFVVKGQGAGSLLVRTILNAVERKRSDAALHASEVRYRRLFEAAKDGILVLDADTGTVVDVNPFLVELLGVSRNDLLGRRLWELGFLRDVAANQEAFAELQDKEFVRYEHLPLETDDGRKMDVEFVSNVYTAGGQRVIQCNIREITARKRAERRERLLRDILERLNHPESTTDAIRDIMHLIKTSTGLDAVAIRLREGDDFPYYGTHGLADSFVQEDRLVCSPDREGQLVDGAHGALPQTCLCRDVLCGRTDPALACFTEAGSFWTNCTTDLSASDMLEEHQGLACHRCNLEGYESVALIPLRANEEIIGLLQFHDRMRNQLSLEMIRFFEGLGSSIGIALTRKRATEQRALELLRLEKLNRLRHTLLATDPLAQKLQRMTDSIVRIIEASFCGIWLIRPGDLCGQGCLHAQVQDGPPKCLRRDACLQLLASSGQAPLTQGESQHRVPYGLYEAGRIAAGSEHKLVTHDVRNDPRMRGSELTPASGLVSFAGYQLRVGEGNMAGVLAVFAKHSITPSEDAILDGLGSTVAMLVNQAAVHDALLDSEKRYRTLFETSADGIVITDSATRMFKYANPALCRMLGYTEQELRSLGVADIHPPDAMAVVAAGVEAVLRGEQHPGADIPCMRKDGSIVYANIIGAMSRIDGKLCNVGFFRDVTERKHAEAGRDKLEAQLRQAQKMEAVGQLAGGVAHDFNNLLTGIAGFTRFALDTEPEDSASHADLTEVLALSRRAATLTRQLLAFSRRQPLQPEVVNINRTVGEMTNMLGRLIGENIDLVFAAGTDLGNVSVDPGQLEQVLVNLAVNARDAMPSGGKLTVETSNVTLDEDYVCTHAGVTPGDYVMMAISDSGCGMSTDTLEHLFEPFFTTKPRGKGTGLGLSTVYGIVKQHGGGIWVYSEPSLGTTFKVYLPRVFDEEVPRSRAPERQDLWFGTETILIVEDEPSVRRMAQRSLEAHGYHVLAAAAPSEADAVLAAHGADVALILTDVVLPERDGHTLYEAAHTIYPHLLVLYTSGYTDDAIVHSGILAPGTAFIQKPFTAEALARKVRDVLASVRVTPSTPTPSN